jgi:hypothetical protein
MKTLRCLTAALLLCGSTWAQDKAPDLPEHLQAKIKALFPGAVITDVDEDFEDGATVFDIELRKTTDGEKCELKLSDDGDVIEMEERLGPESVPASIREAVAAAFPDDIIKEGRKEVKDGEVTYRIELTRDGEVDVAADGQLMDIEITVDPATLPPAVTEALQATVPDARVVRARKNVDEGVEFEIDAVALGIKYDLTIALDGEVLDSANRGPVRKRKRNLTAADLPDAVTQAVNKLYPRSVIEKIDEDEKDGVVTFEIELVKRGDGRECKVELTETGELLDVDEELSPKEVAPAVLKEISRIFPGVAVWEAEKKSDDEELVYELKLIANGAEYEAELTAEGKIIKIERD